MNIPKLAKGGIVNNNLALIGEEKGKSIVPLKDKYYEIYKRTKNRRIKKKQLKKSWKLKWYNSDVFKEINNQLSNTKEITIHIGDKIIVKNLEKEVSEIEK